LSISDKDSEEKSSIPSLRSSLKRRSLKAKEKLCPQCLGKLVVIGELSGWLVPEEYVCEKCGYHGRVSLERGLSEDENSKPNEF
jgi:predicted RNA-binding Zn-ribbon protein involved in translation (DUF1610 family)